MANPRPDLPPLAHYRPLRDWIPHYGDYVVWAGWFSVWHGVVTNYDEELREVAIIFAGLPYLLFTMNEDEQSASMRKLQLVTLRESKQGVFAIQQHDFTRNTTIWYI